MYKLHCRFKCIEDLKFRIRRELQEEFYDDNDFDVGFFEGKHSTKRWLIEDEDLNYMYSKQKSDEIHLWCDLDIVINEPPRKKKREEPVSSRREDKERKVDEALETLLVKHKNTYTKNQLQLWARMITNKLHDSYDDPPPNCPPITGQGIALKPQKKETLTEVIAGAAAAFVKAVSPAATKTPAQIVQNDSGCRLLSPARSADIRMKNLQQLQCLQRLFEDKVLTEGEFMEQKNIILEALRAIV